MAGRRKFPDAGDPSDAKGFLALRERFLEALGIANYSPRTVETMSGRLRAFIVWCDERGLTHPEDVTRAHLERFQAWLFHYRKDDGNPLDFGTQQLHIGAIKLFFKWLVKAGHIPFSPAADLEYPKKGDKLPKAVLSHAEVEQVMAEADPGTVLGLRDRAVVEVLYSTGVRRMELEGVRLEDLNVSAGTLFVRKAKGDKQRVVPLGERALAWVRKYLDDARPKLATDETEQALFLDKEGRALSKRAISTLGKKLLRRANLGKAGSAHVFRHSAATAMLEGGADVRFVQELLGHSSLVSTQVYTRVAISKLREVHAATHPGAKLERQPGRDEEQAPVRGPEGEAEGEEAADPPGNR